jgi:hypothetical protein
MAKPMMTFAARRWRGVFYSATVATLIFVVLMIQSRALRQTAFASGSLLFMAVLFLTAYNLRKKLTYPPLMASSTWLQLHIYVGWLAVFLFLIHTHWQWPTGPFEILLWLAFVSVAGSGIIGLILSRAIPPRLALRSEEVIFERIPIFRRQLRDQAEKLIVRSVELSDQTTLADFYQKRIGDYFFRPSNTWHHLYGTTRPLKQMLHDLKSLRRYLNKDELELANELADLIEAKDDLDYQYAMQGLLKIWFFVHIPMTYILIVFSAVHVVLVLAFRGGLR